MAIGGGVLGSEIEATKKNSFYEENESAVRVYCRRFPVEFARAKGSFIFDQNGVSYTDFFSGAGALNYGHNHPDIQSALVRYIRDDGIMHGLDMHTVAKRRFMKIFIESILKPRGMDYKLQFTGPTGSNVVEAALKLARRYTGRENIIAFHNGFHGMSLGALSATANPMKRQGAGIRLHGVTHIAYDDISVITQLASSFIKNPDSKPAAFILETIQGEGGLSVCSQEWLRMLDKFSNDNDILLIVDDIQAGCGRSGKFFSFEDIGITPDLICLSKSLSGCGQPLSLLLLNPCIDCQKPGEHSGTFRGNCFGFVAAYEAVKFWRSVEFLSLLSNNCDFIQSYLQFMAEQLKRLDCQVRGRGMFIGLRFGDEAMAKRIAQVAFENNILVETCGTRSEVLKIMPPLNIRTEILEKNLKRLLKIILHNF